MGEPVYFHFKQQKNDRLITRCIAKLVHHPDALYNDKKMLNAKIPRREQISTMSTQRTPFWT